MEVRVHGTIASGNKTFNEMSKTIETKFHAACRENDCFIMTGKKMGALERATNYIKLSTLEQITELLLGCMYDWKFQREIARS